MWRVFGELSFNEIGTYTEKLITGLVLPTIGQEK